MRRIAIVEKMKHVIIRQDGNVTVLFAFVFTALLAMTSVVVEGGMLYAVKMHLQKTANATVLSAAQELLNSESNVRSVANQILQAHGETASLQSLTVAMGDRTTVVLKKNVQLILAKALGMDKFPVGVTAAAKLETMGAAVGAVPVGIPQSLVLTYGQQTTLKVDNDLANNGNFGILALGDSASGGASNYEQNFQDGYQAMLSVGDLVDTKTGNVAGDTQNAVNYRINSDPYTEGDLSHRDDPRILLVPVYIACPQTAVTMNDCINYPQTGQLKRIAVTGFAYFYLTQPFDTSNKAIVGEFIKFAGRGMSKPGAVNRGAYAIKLTE